MFPHLRSQLILVCGTMLLCCIGYPLVLLLIGLGLFPSQAGGSLVTNSQGIVIGSSLIAQPCKGDEWFQPRPSAVDYNAAASGGSNLAASNPKLRERVVRQMEACDTMQTVPADVVTTSGSGLDPHITLANARSQLKRIAHSWAVQTQQDDARTLAIIDKFLTTQAFKPLFGLTDSPSLLNVLELNLELQKAFAGQR